MNIGTRLSSYECTLALLIPTHSNSDRYAGFPHKGRGASISCKDPEGVEVLGLPIQGLYKMELRRETRTDEGEELLSLSWLQSEVHLCI